MRGRPEERASRRRHTDLAAPWVSPLTTPKPGHCDPLSPATPVFFLSHALPRFPSHKSLLLTRSLCSEVLRVRAPVGPSCWWLSALQTFLRSKSGGRHIKPLSEAAAPLSLTSRVSSRPRSPGRCLTRPFIHSHARTFPKIYTRVNKKIILACTPSLGRACPGPRALLLGEEDHAAGTEKLQVAHAGCTRRLHTLAAASDF